MIPKPCNDTIQLNNSDISPSVIIPLDVRGHEIARGVIQQNEHKMQVIKVIEMDDYRYVDIRDWNKYGKDGTFHPTKHGVMVRSDTFRDSMSGILIKALQYC